MPYNKDGSKKKNPTKAEIAAYEAAKKKKKKKRKMGSAQKMGEGPYRRMRERQTRDSIRQRRQNEMKAADAHFAKKKKKKKPKRK